LVLIPETMAQTLITPELIAQFRARPLVVLSPHFDDACFSLGCFLEQVRRGTLIDVFTKGTYAPAHKASPAEKSDPDYVHRIRDAEDRAFADRCGLQRIDLGIAEPALHDRTVRSFSALDDDIEAIEAPLAKTLGDVAASWPEGTRGVLFAPMGIGHHVNHRAVAEVVLDNREALAMRYDLFLYEDIPYAYNPLKRRAGLARARAALGDAKMTRHVLPVEWDTKKALALLYASQFRFAPLWLKFRPAAVSPAGLHEAFWAVEPPSL
jgi:LmbE family N-acetylglucosaminyl deacetylase